MSVAFWSCELTGKNSSFEVAPPEGYVLNVQNVAMTGGKNEKESCTVFANTLSVEGEARDTLLGTLRPIACDQFQTQLVFGFDVPVTFSAKMDNSKMSVHLSGYFQPGPDDDMEEDSDDEEGYDDEENMDMYQELVRKGGMEGFGEEGDSGV